MSFPLDTAGASEMKLDEAALARLARLVRKQIDDGHYPGAQIAMARDNRLVYAQSFGDARLSPDRAAAAADTLWLLYSNTKVITASALWILAEQGAICYGDKVAAHVPEFARNGKGDITILQLLTHQAGFPGATVPEACWADHDLLRRTVCDFTLEWTPGSRVSYHGATAHWAAGVLIEAVTGRDFREFIRTAVIDPLGLGEELFIGLPEAEHGRAVDMHEPLDGLTIKRKDENRPEFRRAGVPGGGGYATARGMAAFYQMMLNGGQLNGTRLVSPRTIQFVTRNFTGDRVDEYMGMPMHRGFGPHSRGLTDGIRGLGTIASPRTFGHGGVGSSYCWADPDSGCPSPT